jgi:hypothetical protein
MRVHSLNVLALLVATTLNGCTSWRVQPVSPEQLLNDEHPKAVRVQRPDSSRVILDSPRLVGDSLLGTTHGRPAGVAVADITGIAVRRSNTLKTAGAIVGIAVAIPVVIIGVYCLSTPCVPID